MTPVDFSDLGPAEPPAPRGIRPEVADAVRQAAAVMRDKGAVSDGVVWPEYHLAKWRAKRLIALMVKLGHHQRWQLGRRVWKDADGYRWVVQYLGDQNATEEARRD